MEELDLKYYYKNGLPFDSSLATLLDGQISRIDYKRASLIIIDGPVGTGKTTLAVELVDYINKKSGLPEMNLKKREHPQIALGGADFAGCFRQCDKLKLPVVIYDEAGDFSRRGAITQFNMIINRFFETYRGFRIIVIICLPNFNVLDNQVFDNQIPRALIHLEERRSGYVDYKVYSLSQMNWIRYWYDKLPKGARHKCFMNVIPNFRGHFKNLPPAREKELDLLSTYGKKKLLEKAEINMKGLVSSKDIAKQCGRCLGWFYDQVMKHNFKHSTKIGTAKYYDKTVLNTLLAQVERKVEDKAKV